MGHLHEVVRQVPIPELRAPQVPPGAPSDVENRRRSRARCHRPNIRTPTVPCTISAETWSRKQSSMWTWTCQPFAPSVASTARAQPSNPPNRSASFCHEDPEVTADHAYPRASQQPSRALIVASSISSASAERSSTSHPFASAISIRATFLQLASPGPVLAAETDAVAARVAHRQGEHERRPTRRVDGAHDAGEIVRAAGGDLRGAHRARPHRPTSNEAAVGGGAGAVRVCDHAERRTELRAGRVVPAGADALEPRNPAVMTLSESAQGCSSKVLNSGVAEDRRRRAVLARKRPSSEWAQGLWRWLGSSTIR